jgi:hypothetical protein
MNQTDQKVNEMRQLSAELIDLRPSVVRTGAIILLLRLVSGLLSLGLVVLGIAILAGKNFVNLEIHVNNYSLDAYQLGVTCLVLGVLLQTINWLCRLIRRRNWYILHSFEVLDWVSVLSVKSEKSQV